MLLLLPLNTSIHFIKSSFDNYAKYSLALNSFSYIYNYNKKHNFYIILLPSLYKKVFDKHTTAILVINHILIKKKYLIGKAGLNKLKGFRSIVRGVAKNPVDHPHGGRTKTIKCPLTP